MSNTALDYEMCDQLAFELAGERFVALLSGGLYWPRVNALLLADLHLEKGSAFALRGQFLPPYDSLQTLNQLTKDIATFEPEQVMCLGDSFHDRGGPDRLSPDCRDILGGLMQGRRWSWISGNHDPEGPVELGGEAHAMLIVDGIGLTHEPGSLLSATNQQVPGSLLSATDADPNAETAETTKIKAEIAGHLHPVATIANRQRGRALRRRAFVIGKERLILPAYGSYTGGLNIRDEAFAALLEPATRLVIIGRQTLSAHPVVAASQKGAR